MTINRDPNAAIRAELRRLLAAIQPGEWFLYGEPEVGLPPDVFRKKPEGYIAPVYDDGVDALRLTIAARNALPALLDEIDACRRWIGKQTADQPFCYRCEVLDDRGYCGCEIAANE